MFKIIKRYFKRILLLVGVLMAILTYRYLWLCDGVIAPIYDVVSGQTQVEAQGGIKNVLASLPKLTYQELPEQVQAQMKEPKGNACAKQDFEAYYKKQTFYKVEWLDRYKYLVKHFRIKDFLTPDRLFKYDLGIPFTNWKIPLKNRIRIVHQDKVQYLFINVKVLEKLLALSEQLETKGLKPNFYISSGFRNPVYNGVVNGATCSRHQYGDALDIYIGQDYNDDGVVNKKDRDLVHQLLESTIIKSAGGLGTYKSSTQVIHFDTRGYRARWNY